MHAHTDVLRQLFTRPAVKPSLSGSRMIRYYMYMYVHVCVCGGWGGGGHAYTNVFDNYFHSSCCGA